MPSVDISQVPELVSANGRKFMFEGYEEEPLVYPRLVTLYDPADAESPFYGDRGSVGQGVDRFQERADSQPVPRTSTGTAYSWQGKIRQFSTSIEVPDRMLRSADAQRKVGSLISAWAVDFGRTARLDKEDFIADLFQKGTLTAAQKAWFDNSYVGNPDSNAGFIYDGLPWFDTAHPIGGAIPSPTTYGNHVVSRTLTQTNLGTSLDDMQVTNAINDRGDRIRNRMNILMVPAGAMERTARVILESGQLPGSANNDSNTLMGSLELVAWDALDDAASASSWWLLNSRRGSGVRCYDSGVPTISTHRDEDKKTTVVTAEFLFGATVEDWRYAGCYNKAAS